MQGSKRGWRRCAGGLAAGVFVAAIGAASLAVAQPAPPGPEQIAAITYSQNCSVCHGPALEGSASGGALKGQGFIGTWGGQSAKDLLDFVRVAMPPSAPGRLEPATYATIVEHILRVNGAQVDGLLAGASDERLAAISIPTDTRAIPPERQAELIALAGVDIGFGASARFPIPPAPARTDRFAGYTPVTAEMLAHPAPENWLTWRRSHYGLGNSPLGQITRENVGGLRLAWSLDLAEGEDTNEPLVRDGVLYVFAHGDQVFALDAADGHVLWHYQRGLPRGIPVSAKKTLALWGDKIYASTSDLFMIALDARTGKLVWETKIADRAAFRNPGGPLVADGVVMQGLTGGGPGGSLIAGFDAETGAKLWSFNTVANEGEPGGDTWNGLPTAERSGGSSWTSGTYDPESGVAFFGTGATYDTGPMRNRKPGMNNDALFTDTTLAFEPRTGELRWYFQHMKNDQFDLDWVFDRVIGTLEVEGEPRRVVMTAGKEGLFDVLDAASGKYIKTIDMGLQDFVTAIDPVTGDKTVDPAKIPDGTKPILVCPHGGGGRNWGATAFDERSARLFVVARDVCTDLRPSAGKGFLSTGVNVDYAARPGSDGNFGLLQAIDMAKGTIAWQVRQRATFNTSVLATEGGILFAGSVDRKVKAWDQATGAELWSAGLPGVPNGGPISFAVDGKQYVAFITGHGNALSTGIPSLAQELQMPPVSVSAIYVFALPD